MVAQRERITRADIEAKLSELRGHVEREAEAARGVAVTVGVVVAAAVVVGAYLWGRRHGRSRRALVEVTRA